LRAPPWDRGGGLDEEARASHAGGRYGVTPLGNEIEIVNNRPMNVWLYALCRKYVADDDEAAENQAEVEVKGESLNF